MKTLYWTYRPERIGTVDLNNLSLNGTYTPSFYLNSQFWDWHSAWLTNIVDNTIPEEAYTWEIAPWIPKLTRFMLAEYNETYVDEVELARSITNVWARFNIDMVDVETARQWIRENTSLQEIETGKFLISEASEMMGEVVEAKYLIIE